MNKVKKSIINKQGRIVIPYAIRLKAGVVQCLDEFVFQVIGEGDIRIVKREILLKEIAATLTGKSIDEIWEALDEFGVGR